jgi:hypothetical protein
VYHKERKTSFQQLHKKSHWEAGGSIVETPNAHLSVELCELSRSSLLCFPSTRQGYSEPAKLV